MKLVVTLEIDVSDMSDEELTDAGYYEFSEEGEPDPTVSDYHPKEVAECVRFALMSSDVKDEMFAGSDMFLNVGNIQVVSAQYE